MHLSPRDRSAYLSEDTIAAVATSLGGPTAMIRVSGPGCDPVLLSLTGLQEKGGLALEKFPERKLVRTALYSLGERRPLDDALVARFKAPDSFTGEDVLELHLHGSAFVAQAVMETLLELGARQALPGEFSFRAVRNGKMKLAQAQAVAELIEASNAEAVALALEKMSGTQNRLFSALAEDLRKLASLAELGIDFADQDVDEVSLPTLKRSLERILTSLERLHASFDRGTRIQEGLKAAFIGLPNAGKSSFFNALLGEERSIVSDIPGTTRDVVHERLTLKSSAGSVTLRLEDTAGLRHASDQIESIGIERSRKAAQQADLVLFVVDATSRPEEIRQEWGNLRVTPERVMGVFSKIDLVESSTPLKLQQGLHDLGIPRWVATSAETGAGIEAAIDQIVEHCARFTQRAPKEVLLTRLDHRESVAAALDHLGRARHSNDSALFAADLRQGLHALSPLIGETLPDDLLAQIFSSFCIGK
jgi:tRNA modification GTPase